MIDINLTLQYKKKKNNSLNTTFITLDVIYCALLRKKKQSLWFRVQSEFSQKWEGARAHHRHGHTSLSGKDKVFPNEDLFGFLLLPETINVPFTPETIHPKSVKHCCYETHCR